MFVSCTTASVARRLARSLRANFPMSEVQVKVVDDVLGVDMACRGDNEETMARVFLNGWYAGQVREYNRNPKVAEDNR